MIAFWNCECGKTNSAKMKTCRKCGKSQPVYGIIEPKTKKRKAPHQPKKIDYSKVKDPLIGTEEQVYVSTMPKDHFDK